MYLDEKHIVPRSARGQVRRRRNPAVVAVAGADVLHTLNPIYHGCVSDALSTS
ncbi:hypothetical protein A2U01_0066414, partial [Trifolium medium]|nr:hypothetical protein [Trifolium medium]